MAEGELHCRVKGKSIPVPNVQALSVSLNGSSQIPERYVRPEAEAEPVVCCDGLELPVIDLSRLVDKEFSSEEAAKLHSTCRDWGFFQLVNHGVPEEVIEGFKADVIEFFKKPLEEKMAYEQQPGNLEGYGHAFVLSDEQKLDWSDSLYLVTRPLPLRNFKFWPLSPSTFRDKVSTYSVEVKKIANSLSKYIALNLGIDPEGFEKIFKDQPQSLKFNYFPPCREAGRVLGGSAHSDATGLTILLQINDVQGLQIKKDGNWIGVNPLPGAFIVNIGDIIEVMSNGIYKSIKHRVVINNERERLSVAAFHGADRDATIAPLPEIVGDGKPNYRSIAYNEFMKILFSDRIYSASVPDKLRV